MTTKTIIECTPVSRTSYEMDEDVLDAVSCMLRLRLVKTVRAALDELRQHQPVDNVKITALPIPEETMAGVEGHVMTILEPWMPAEPGRMLTVEITSTPPDDGPRPFFAAWSTAADPTPATSPFYP